MTFKTFWKSRGFKSWFCSFIPVFTLLLAIVLVLTCNTFVYQTINSVLGGEQRVLKSGDVSKYQYYTADYADKKSVLKAANSFNEEIAEEGTVLLKNDDNALPLATGSKVTVFGKNSVNLVLGGSGSNASAGGGSTQKTVYDSLTAAGIEYNPDMKSFYEDSSRSGDGRPQSPDMNSTITGLTGFPIGETPVNRYNSNSSLSSSWRNYNDAAIVVITRIGGEGFDLPRTMFWDGKGYMNWSGSTPIPGARNKDDHYLQLDQNETDMIMLAAAHFDKVVVVLNSPTAMELGFLDDETHYAYSDKIKACLWIGTPGNTGIMALGRILTGTINPSGRTVDIYARDFKNDPTWNNFGNNIADGGNQYVDESGQKRNAYFVHYSEGIYVGYRYYETRDYVESEKGNNGWYDKNVVYPFGYGLSYSQFEWRIKDPSTPTTLDPNGMVSIKVEVTNVSSVPGRDVVQLYYSAPYNEENDLEKSHVVLGDFQKTEIIPAGESRSVTLQLSVRDMASYDYNDGNHNDFVGYELEQGTYTLYLARNSHDRSISLEYYLDEDATFATDSNTGANITNLFDDVSDRITQYMSRKDFDGTFPQLPSTALKTLSASDISSLSYKLNDKATDAWYSNKMPTQSSSLLSFDETKVKLWDLIGKDYNDPLWDELMNQLTVAQMRSLIEVGNYHTEAIANIDKPLTTDPDGPMGYSLFMGDSSVYDTCYYASESLVGSTWNTEIAERFGVMIGNESLIGNEKGDGRTYAGWYAPACNLHRSPFGGRNFEYYSEDPVLSAKMTVNVVKGAKSKGVYTYVKHFALNDQETNRDTNGIAVWANEQSMREMYFLPFEKAVKDGGTTAMMSSFNRIGFTWAGGNYNLLTKLLRNEWGFRGMVITDYNLQTYMNVDQMIRAGGDINLSQSKALRSYDTATSVTAIRRAAKNILYTVANSNAMNGMGEGNIWIYIKPVWFICMWVAFSVITAGFIVWGTLVMRKVVVGYKADVSSGRVVPVQRKPIFSPTVSILLAVVTAVAITCTVTAAYYLNSPAETDPVSNKTQSYISAISLLFNDSEIQNNIINLELGEHGQLGVKVQKHGTISDEVTFASGNPEIVAIDELGTVTAMTVGECVVTATSVADRTVYSNVLVRVTGEDDLAATLPHSITVSGGYASVSSATVGTTVMLTPAERDGMTFTGWHFSVEVQSFGNIFFMPTTDVVVTAVYERNHYKLTLQDATFKDGSTEKDLLFEDAFPTDINYTVGSNQMMFGWLDVETGEIVDGKMPARNLTIRPNIRTQGSALTMGSSGWDTGTGTTVSGVSSTNINGVSAKQFTVGSGKNMVRIRSGGVSGAGDKPVYISITLRNDNNFAVTLKYEVESYGLIWGTEFATLQAGETRTFGIIIQGLASSETPYHRVIFEQNTTSDTTISFCGYLMV